MLYFGEPWDAPVVDEGCPTATPVGQPCIMCSIAIEDGDRGFVLGHLADDGTASAVPMHRACMVLNTCPSELAGPILRRWEREDAAASPGRA